MWLRYLLEAEEATRTCLRVWTSFDGLLDNWEGTVQSIADGLGIVWANPPESIASEVPKLLRSGHRHYRFSNDPAPASPGPLTIRAWQAALAALEGNETGARAGFDEIRESVTELDP